MKILVLNSGSSSQKSSLYDIRGDLPTEPPKPDWEAKIEWDGDRAEIKVATAAGAAFSNRLPTGSRREATEELLKNLWTGPARVLENASEISIVGHRIVNGGKDYEQPTLVTTEVKAAIARMASFAPLHNRAELDGIEIIAQKLGSVPQVAVFDTGFHSRMPEPAAVYPGPYEWLARGIRRYGFHGINHKYCAERAAKLLGRDLGPLKLVTCHLGNGCSLAAIRDGHSVDTTMGFTPLEGLMMGTRSGSVDPGILIYLMRESRLTGDQMDALLNTKSGLLGISGVSGDMRQVVGAMKDGNERAKLAFEIFVHRLRSCMGSMIAVLGAIDAVVFTAGMGENSPEVRAAVCANLAFVGAKLDMERNAQPELDADISLPDSRVRILVIRAQEDWAIARDCWRFASLRSALVGARLD
ncbi:MAG: acetate kinase [Candidatus Acidiferrales bacterium]